MKLPKMGALVGEAGSGRTETIREFGHLIGKPIFTFCCGEDTKVKDIENNMKAAGYAGAIVLADEINKIQDDKKWFEVWR